MSVNNVSDTVDLIFREILAGHVVPFLGAGVNLFGRSEASSNQLRHFLPSGTELAERLIERFGYPENEDKDLLRVAQYVAVMLGTGRLYEELRQIFNVNVSSTPIHHFWAVLSQRLSEKGYPKRHLLIITTNYDYLLENAFQAVGEPFDLVYYMAQGSSRGKFYHLAPSSPAPVLIDKPNEYIQVSRDTAQMVGDSGAQHRRLADTAGSIQHCQTRSQ